MIYLVFHNLRKYIKSLHLYIMYIYMYITFFLFFRKIVIKGISIFNKEKILLKKYNIFHIL